MVGIVTDKLKEMVTKVENAVKLLNTIPGVDINTS
jgi:hypothetical protein